MTENLEGQGKQGIADEDRRRLVEPDVNRVLTAAHGIVVHARQIVVDQRIGVNHFDGSGDPQCRSPRDSEHLSAGQGGDRAKPLAGGEGYVPHRLEHLGFGALCFRQQIIENAVYVRRRRL